MPSFFMIYEEILNIIFPEKCGICNKICENGICEQCKNKINNIKKVIVNNNFKRIEKNLNSKIIFDEHIYFFKYQGLIREKIIQYKFKDKPYLYKMFATVMKSEQLLKKYKYYDYIIPVPINKKRMKQRGYNQSLLIAKYIARQSNCIEFENNILRKIKNIKPQSSMGSRKERINNIKGVYEINELNKIKNKKILIFDDIFTTGSTANECAKVLKENGAEKVGIITIAKD